MFRGEAIHNIQKAVYKVFRVVELAVVGDPTPEFHREAETRRSSLVPTSHHGLGGDPIKRSIHFHRGELLRDETQPPCLVQSLRIHDFAPMLVVPATGSDENLRHSL